MKKHHKKSTGFSIIEMMVVIFIIGIMSAILVVNWRKNEKIYLIQRMAQEIAQNIRKAQDLALTSKKYGSQPMPDSSYGIHFSINTPTSYFIFGDMNKNETYQPSDFKIDNGVSMLSGAQIDYLSAGNSLDITFSIPDGFTYINGSQATLSTIIRIKKTGAACPSISCRSIIIKNTGQISIQ